MNDVIRWTINLLSEHTPPISGCKFTKKRKTEMELFENKSIAMNKSIIFCSDSIFTNDQVDYRLYGNLPVSIFGILINLINIIIFSHADMRRSLVNLFLLAISIADLLLLIFNFFFLLFPVIALFSNSFTLKNIYPVVLRCVHFTTVTLILILQFLISPF